MSMIRKTILAFSGLLVAAPSIAQTTSPTITLPPLEVTGIPLSRSLDDVAAPASVLAGPGLDQRRAATLGETVREVPGVTSSHFGAGASRPIIRGFDGPRVRVLNDGVDTLDAASVSPDHAVTSDPFGARQIEILKGPSTLLYGGGAIGGVVNVIDSRIPTAVPTRGYQADTGLHFNSSAEEIAGFLGFTVGHGNVAARLEGTARNAQDYYTARGFGDPPSRRVRNSFNNGWNFSAGTSWIDSWGYVGAAYGEYRSQYGLPNEETVLINMRSQRLDMRGEVREPFDGIEKVRFRLANVWYQHQEVEDESIATTFHNHAFDGRLEVVHRLFDGLRGVAGVQGLRRDFTAIGDEAFLPPTLTQSFGLFLIERYSFGQFHVEGGLRYDWQHIRPTGDLPTRRHDGFSASISGTWDFAPGYAATIAFSRSQRLPTAEELFANGPHIATGQFEVGDVNLRPETSYNLEIGLRKKTGALQFGVSVYRNVVNNFIFQSDTGAIMDDLRVINFRQADAELYGLEAEAKYAVNDNIDVSVFGDYVRARLTNSDNLPRIPPGRLGARIDARHEIGPGSLSGFVQFYHVFGQGHVAPVETATPGYNMLNVGIAYGGQFNPINTWQVYLRANNLLNEHAIAHTSFIKNAAPLPGINLTLGTRFTF
ncbi:MAG: TonB-dependent receptor [Alphaproteobacteria bacterium]|nr:TonB-dependent receptor [Alphaproteobacteria bacterium]MCW5741251.1 TonB-dependent receptor [Alphaproteobacteria bacterium]